MSDLLHPLSEHRLTTAEILYHLPDHRSLLQTYIWQGYDQAPRYPILRKFLDFWENNLDGPLHSVRVTNVPVLGPSGLATTSVLLTLH